MTATAGAIDLIGNHNSEYQVSIRDESFNANIIRGSIDYPETMDLRLTWGRFFDNKLVSDLHESIIVNNRFVSELDISDPAISLVTIDSIDYNIVGVVEDFHYSNFSDDIEPTIIRAYPDSLSRYMVVKVNSNELSDTYQIIKNRWHKLVDNDIYQGYIQAEVFDFYFEEMRGLRNTFLFTASFAILLSAMGLFGLVSLNISAKIKDYSIKKILGASLTHLSKSILKKYLLMWVLASLIGGYLGSVAISSLLSSVYSFHPGVGTVPIILALTVLLLVILITISSQLVKVDKTNPSQTLRLE
ncbi:MAG: FtsX-like permease family protein [Bacteroidota bacterium]